MNRGITQAIDGAADTLAAWANHRWGSLLFVAIAFVGILAPSTGADPDLFARLAVGRLVSELGYLPLQDPFSFGPTYPIWIDHEWLSGVFFWSVWRTFGDGGLLLLRAFLVALCAVGTLKAAQFFSPNLVGARILWVVYALAASAFAFASPVRCQAFTYAFVPWTILWCLHYLHTFRLRSLLLFPPLLVLWANLHGGFVLGLGVLGAASVAAFCLTECSNRPPRLRQRVFPLFVLAVSIAATGLNPYGLVPYWGYILHALTMPRPAIAEWAPVTLETGLPIILILMPLVLGLCLRQWRCPLKLSSLGLFGTLLVVGSLGVALRQVRMIALLGLTCAIFGWPIVASAVSWLANVRLMGQRQALFGRALWLAAGLLCTLGLVRFFTIPLVLNRNAYPEAPIEFLKSLSPRDGRLLVDFNNGSFALFHLYPQFRVSLDGRYEEVYPESTRALVERALFVPGDVRTEALGILDPTHALLGQDSNLAGFGPEWEQVYKDQAWKVLQRRGPSTHSAAVAP